jgi:eukaryotic-like serine/threonine-protein kinase
MMPLSDAAVASLRALADWPDTTDTKYDILERIGRGGMGSVYLAHDRALDRRVAIKVVSLPEPAGTTGLAGERLTREARILAGLEHPGLVPVHDAGVLADGRPYYVMKWIRGTRLDAYLQSSRTEADRLRIFARMCDAVAFAHQSGVIHRDLTPANIMVGAFGEVLVLDWGLARIRLDRSGASPATTQPGTVMGTAGFIAPEVAAGRSDASDERSDVFALGGLLEVLTQPRPGQSIPRPLAAVIAKARAASPADRYPAVETLAADVERYAAGDPVRAYREGPLEWGSRLATRHQTAIVLVAVYIVIRVMLLAFR